MARAHGETSQAEAMAGLRAEARAAIPDGVRTDAGIELEAAMPVGASRLMPVGSGLEAGLGLATAAMMSDGGASGAGSPVLDEPSGVFAPSLEPLLQRGAAALGVSGEGADGTGIAERFQRLLETVHANRPGDDLGIIRKAWVFCVRQHDGQKRASGEPYVVHPLEVGQLLAELKMDSTAIAAGLLHDAVEDTDITTEEIERQFGEQVAHIVEGVTKLDKIKFANREDHQAENIRKMLLAMVTDVRVVIIKLADRLHNMRTLQHLRPEKQQKIARETLDIFAPLAHRLGMGKLRGELEDLAFRYTDPFTYEQVSSEVDALRVEGESFLERIVGELEAKLAEHHLEGRVESRIKRLYSIQQKLESQKIPVDQVYDLLAIRVICKTVQDCYAVLGLLHSVWRPVPGGSRILLRCRGRICTSRCTRR